MMTPFIQKFSEAGILLHAPISENAKFPILLPRKNQIVDDDRSFSARNLVVQKCIHCFRYKPVLMNQIMGNQSAFEDQQSQFQLFVVEKGIEWRFIPPRATHFGSLWEAAVKSAKEILVRQVADASLTEVDVRAYLVLNSRPLTPTSTDPNEGEVLTLGHLLIGEALRSLPQGLEPDAPTRGLRYSKRW